jgi:HemY protein
MIRNLWLILMLAGLAMAAGWMAEHPGEVTLQWFGYEVQTYASFLAVAVLATLLLLWLGLKLVMFLLFMPQHVGRMRGQLSHQRGLAALTDAFIALGDQDHAAAEKQLQLAQRTLPDPTLPHLLSLQLARQQGDEAKLRSHFLQLQETPQTRPLALRGLIEEARREKHLHEATTLAQLRELLELKPRHKPTLLLAIDVYSGLRRWQESLQWIMHGQRKWVFSRSEAKKLAAMVYTEQAAAMLASQNPHSAEEMLKAAIKRAPELSAATLLLVPILTASGKMQEALPLLRKAWKAEPHPELAQCYARCLPALSPEKKLKKMQDFVSTAPASHLWEGHHALGRFALEAGLYPQAREALLAAAGIRETMGLCKLLAELERQEKHDDAKASYWLEQMAVAQPDALWRCRSCGHQPATWHAHCPECGQFESVHWQPAQYSVFITKH